MNKIFFALAASLTLVGIARADSVTPHTLVAHAGEQFWIARVDRYNNADFSWIDFRIVGQDDRWQRLSRFEVGIDALASQGTTLGAILRDGSWSIVYSDGTMVSPGLPPASSQLLAVAGSTRGWWAVAQVQGGMRAAMAATRPATRPSSSTQSATAPATEPIASQSADGGMAPVLFELSANDWTPLAQVPDAAGQGVHAALAVIDQAPHIGLYDGGTLRVLHLENGRWVTDLESRAYPQVAAFKFLSDAAPPRLWVQQQTGPDTLITLGKSGAVSLPLEVPSSIAAKDRDVVLFGHSIRMVGRNGDKVVEQRFDPDTLKPQGPPANLALPDTTQLVDLQGLHTLVAIVSLMMVLLGWFRQQAASEGVEPNLEGVTLAPLSRRFLAGLIDASPVILTMAFYFARHGNLPGSVPQSRQFLFFAFYWSSGLFYVVHTTLIETYAGRTLGKIMLGLRVVTMQGTTPEPGALFNRNILRIFDLSLFFFPMIFIPFSPLRQRSGDLAAGTVVVLEQGEKKADSKPEE